MTGPADDLLKNKGDDAARKVAESLLGVNIDNVELGGELLFDDYDDPAPVDGAATAPDAGPKSTEDQTAVVQASLADAFDEELDDLIVFEDDEDDTVDEQEPVGSSEDDENFSFGDDDTQDEDDLDDEDEDPDDEDEDPDDDPDLEDRGDILTDDDLDFESDDDPIPPRRTTSASVRGADRSPRPREDRSEAREAVAGHRDDRASARDTGRQPRDDRDHGWRHSRQDRPPRRDARGEDSGNSGREVREIDDPHGRQPRYDGGSRSAASETGRGESRAERASKPALSDDDYWQELDDWVWDDRPTAGKSASHDAEDVEDEPDDAQESAAGSTAGGSADSPRGRRGRRRGGRGRGRRRREGDVQDRSGSPGHRDIPLDAAMRSGDDDDLQEILFDEDDSEGTETSKFKPRSGGRLPEQPVGRASDHSSSRPEERPPRRNSLDAIFDADSDSDEPQEDDFGPRDRGRGRGRRGGRGRGRDRGEREESRVPPERTTRDRGPDRAPAEEREEIRARRRGRFDDDDVDDDLLLDEDEPEQAARSSRRERIREREERPGRGDRPRHRAESEDRAERSEREPRDGWEERGRRSGRSDDDRVRDERVAREERPADRRERTARSGSGERPERVERDERGERTERNRREERSERESRGRGEEGPVREERAPEDGLQGERGSRVAPEFRNVPTWEDAIGYLAIKSPSEDASRRTESRTRGSRDSGRPPRRR